MTREDRIKEMKELKPQLDQTRIILNDLLGWKYGNQLSKEQLLKQGNNKKDIFDEEYEKFKKLVEEVMLPSKRKKKRSVEGTETDTNISGRKEEQ